MAKTRRILISGYYGFSNAGDEAVLSAIVSGLKSLGGAGIEITVLSAKPDETSRLYEVQSVPRNSWKEVREAIRSSDLVISGGGSLIQDATSLRSLLYYLWIIRLGQKYKRRVMILGQGIGPLRRRTSRWMTRLVLDRVDLITVRDADSARLLKEIGVCKPVHITADPAFLLGNVRASVPEALRELFTASDVITLALREWQPAGLVERAVIKALQELDLPVRFFLAALHPPRDLDLAKRIACQVSTVAAQTGNLTVRELLGVISRSRMVVGIRLHALIFAAIHRVPMIGIAYDPKVESFLSVVGQDCMSLDELRTGSLARRIANAWNHRDELASRLAERVPPLVNAAEENIRLALELLN